MVEISIPSQLLYQYGDDQTTEAREEAYVRRIKNMLEGASGFLAAKVLSDPSSLDFLQQKLDDCRGALALSEGARKAAQDEIDALTKQVSEGQSRLAQLSTRLTSATKQLDDDADELRRLKKDLLKVQNELVDSNKLVIELEHQRKIFFYSICAVGGMVCVAIAYWLLP